MSEMNLDEPGDTTTRALSGFRLRWRSKSDAADASEVASVQVSEPCADFEQLFGDLDTCEDFSQHGSWDHIPADDDGYEPEPPLDFPAGSSGVPVVYDPKQREPAWTHCAVETVTKRQKIGQPKLPWEQGPFSQVFQTGNFTQGTILDNYKDIFVPARLGCEDVLNSSITDKPHTDELAALFEPPVVSLNFRRVRHELPDEDIRRVAICKLRDLLLQDPMATQLGVSIRAMTSVAGSSASADQSIRDCFRMKASSTLQKRAGSLWRLAKLLRGIGQLNPLRVKEEQLYLVLCQLRDSGAGATAAQHMIEALHFLDATAKFLLLDIRTVVSGRCRGVAKDLYLTKNPLEQKHPLLLSHVRYLEHLFPTLPNTMKCILGQLLFCVHACCRWKDSQRLKSLTAEQGHGETLVHAEALQSKTATSAEARTRFLPYVALGTGVTGAD
eukprot:s357_g1.t1